MPTETVEKPVKPRKQRATRRNYAKEIERVTTYLETVIRIKGQSFTETASDMQAGELRAYRDVLDFVQGGVK